MEFVAWLGGVVLCGAFLWIVIHTAVLSALRQAEKERRAAAEGTKILR